MTNFLTIYVYLFVFGSAVGAFLGFIKHVNRYVSVGVFLAITSSILLLVLRDPLAPSDAGNYSRMYGVQTSFENIFHAYHGNVFFSFLQFIGNILGLSAKQFSIVQSIFFYAVSLLGLRLIFESNRMFLMSISFFSLTSTFILLFTNVVRQGLALSLIILAIGLFVKNNRFLGYFFSVLAIFSHFSALIIGGIFFFVRHFNLKRQHLFMVLLAIPFTPTISQTILTDFASFGGLFQKIETFSNTEYNNYLVYIKMIALYLSGVIFYFIGVHRGAFKNKEYNFIFKLYLLMLFFIFFTAPVLLLSSRYLYYASALLPILYTFVMFHNPNVLSAQGRLYLGLVASVIFGLFVYSFNSTRVQLGLLPIDYPMTWWELGW